MIPITFSLCPSRLQDSQVHIWGPRASGENRENESAREETTRRLGLAALAVRVSASNVSLLTGHLQEGLTYPIVWDVFITEQFRQRYEVRVWWKASHHFYLVNNEKYIYIFLEIYDCTYQIEQVDQKKLATRFSFLPGRFVQQRSWQECFDVPGYNTMERKVSMM